METESIGIMGNIIENKELIALLIPALLGVFSVIAKWTKTKSDDRILNFLLKIVHTFGLTKKEAIDIKDPVIK